LICLDVVSWSLSAVSEDIGLTDEQFYKGQSVYVQKNINANASSKVELPQCREGK